MSWLKSFSCSASKFQSEVCCRAYILHTNVLFLSFENGISGIICSLFRGRQNIFLTIFSSKFAVKCGTKIWKIDVQMHNNVQILCAKIFLNREFSIEK